MRRAALALALGALACPKVAPTPSATACGPCDGPALFTQPPPASADDLQLLALCPDAPTGRIDPARLRAFVAAHQEQLAPTVGALGVGPDEAVDWLMERWGAGATHVFCGDGWQGERIGGLHFAPRYAQLERQGRLCYLGPVRGEGAVAGHEWLVRFRGVAPWSCATKPIGGFPTHHDGLAQLAIGARAVAACCAGGRRGGVFGAGDLGDGGWQVHCGGPLDRPHLQTLYPTQAPVDCVTSPAASGTPRRP